MSCTLAVSVCSAAENVTLYSILAEADPTQIDLLSTINASAVSVVGSATEYIVSEVITQILENDVAGTKTGPIPGRLLTAPVTSICLCCFSSRQSAGSRCKCLLDTIDEAFLFCQSCQHGGHAAHILEWFRADYPTRRPCAVADCNCFCNLGF